MKTRTKIVAMASNLNGMDGATVKALDDALLERAQAFKGQPAEQAEWLLGWALALLQSTARKLEDACVRDTRIAHDIGNAVRWGAALPSLNFSNDAMSRMPELLALHAQARETFARALDAYKALALDVVPESAS